MTANTKEDPRVPTQEDLRRAADLLRELLEKRCDQ